MTPVVISEEARDQSEQKRLTSLKKRKQTFKARGQTISDALRSVDNKKSKKIVFDDDIDLESYSEKRIKDKPTKKKNNLFDSDDENEEKIEWDDEELAAKANVKKKLLKLKTNIGNDKRFELDERFIDDEDGDQPKEENSKEENLDDERKWQLDILGDVLGKSVVPPTAENGEVKKKSKMVRYDPTATNHEDYEITIEKPKGEKSNKKKKKVSIIENQEENPIPISKEVFYDVSENLIESLKQNEGFSLLKTFGRDTSNTDESKDNINKNNVEETGESFQFNFSAKNPFKYDSSDGEDDNEEPKEKNNLSESNNNKNPVHRQTNDRLFFSENDPRFKEAENFFKNVPVYDEEAFKHTRRKLKEIVRAKIRNNIKKTEPWKRKKIGKVRKKHT